MKKGLKELTVGMQRLCAVANRIVSENGKSSRIEIDLLLENLRSLYDTALQLAETNGDTTNDDLLSSTMMATRAAMQMEKVEPEVAKENPTPEPEPEPVHEPVHEPEPASEPVPVPEPEPVSEPEPAPEPVHEPAPDDAHMVEAFEGNENNLLFDEVIIEPEPVDVPEPEPVVETKPEIKEEPVVKETPKTEPQGQASLLDYLKETPAVRTLGESLGMNATQAANLERKVSDLRTAININDKFSFITELFHSNMRGYNDFIMQLNDITDRDTATSLVNQVAEQYKWDEGSAAVKSFRKIFDKKF